MTAKRLLPPSLLLIFVILALPSCAGAAWPGGNGRIVYRALEQGFEAEGQEPVGLAWTSGRRGAVPHQLTTDPTDQDPQVSPDGRLIAFARQVAPQQPESAVHHAIFVVHFDGSGLRQLTAPPEECVDGKPTFAPRGERLFFIRHCHGPARGTDTWGVDADGSNLTKLEGRRGRSGASVFSPTGRQVIFLRRSENGPRLISMRPDGSRRRDITPPLGRERQIESFDFSPNGRVIVLAAGFSVFSHLFTIRADGRKLKQLSDPPSGYGEPAFSPDGREVVAIAYGHSGPATLVRFELGGDGRPGGVPGVRYGDMPVWAPMARP
jgi:Tol biopolymer transport system component